MIVAVIVAVIVVVIAATAGAVFVTTRIQIKVIAMVRV